MIYRRPIIYSCVTLAAVGPVLTELRAANNCDVRMELCEPSEAAYLPDEQAPDHAPLIIVAPVAGYTSSAPHSAMMAYPMKT